VGIKTWEDGTWEDGTWEDGSIILIRQFVKGFAMNSQCTHVILTLATEEFIKNLPIDTLSYEPTQITVSEN
jgi:hypothetical protein